MGKIILNITHPDKRKQRVALSNLDYAIKAASEVVGDNPKILDAVASIKDGTRLTCKGATMSELFPFAELEDVVSAPRPLTPQVIFDAAVQERALDEQPAREDAVAPAAKASSTSDVHAAVGVAFGQLRKDKVVAGFSCGKAKDAPAFVLLSIMDYARSKHNVGVCVEITADKREAAYGCKVLRIATTSECPLDGLTKVVSLAMVGAGLTIESTAEASDHILMAVSLRGGV